MHLILSPAKNLRTHALRPKSKPALLHRAAIIAKRLQALDPLDLRELMNISAKLAEQNHARHLAWTPDGDMAAVMMFNGDVYEGLDVDSLDDTARDYLQAHASILSGLYGVLRPFDAVCPYRLEMGTRLLVDGARDLYTFWGDLIANEINNRADVLINLASNEYFKAVSGALKAPIITPRFEDFSGGKYKVVSFYAKRARGLMARFAAQNQAQNPDDLKNFDLDGYGFVDIDSDKHGQVWRYQRRQNV